MALPQRKSSQANRYQAANQVDVAMAETEQAQSEYRPQQPMLRIGEILKRERERRGYDLQQIADYLCIRRGLLTALESGRYEEFPADAYVIGFLRSYAELIGLNGQDAIDYYRQEMAGRRHKPDLVLPTPISEGRAPTAAIMGAAALVSLLIYILWYAFSTTDRASVSTPPVLPPPAPTSSLPAPVVETPSTTSAGQTATDTLAASAPSGIAISAPPPAQKTLEAAPTPVANATAPAAPESISPITDKPVVAEKSAVDEKTAAIEKSAATAKPAVTPPPTGSTSHLVVRANESSWVLVADDKGQTIFDRVMKVGETFRVPSTPGLTLTTGNGAGISLILDGKELPKLSTASSHMVRNISLDPQALKSAQ